ncbi:MAG: arsenite methyltransferase [Melioribacteraceae bacterium]
MDKDKIKLEIKKSYGEIAKGNIQVGCCSTENGCCSTDEFSTCMAEDYSEIAGYQKDADLSLGCGLPTEIANIQEGDTVIDLGSGAGNDAFIARSIVGESGKVIGIDMTQEMVNRALQNNQKLGYKNVEFVLSEIENMMSIQSNIADVIISNCVMNLVIDKEKAFSEIFRVLKLGGHFSISDIVYAGSIPVGVLNASEMHVGCVSGASEKDEYLRIIEKVGFRNIQIKKERKIELSDELLLKYLNEKELSDYKNSGSGIFSVTIYADKLEEGNCSDSSGGCCCNGATNNRKEETKKSNCCG